MICIPHPRLDFEEYLPHWVVEASCGHCGHEWVAVVRAEKLPSECPDCHKYPFIWMMDDGLSMDETA